MLFVVAHSRHLAWSRPVAQPARIQLLLGEGGDSPEPGAADTARWVDSSPLPEPSLVRGWLPGSPAQWKMVLSILHNWKNTTWCYCICFPSSALGVATFKRKGHLYNSISSCYAILFSLRAIHWMRGGAR